MRLDNVEVADALATTILLAIEQFQVEGKPGIPVGQDPTVAIDDLEYDAGEDEVRFHLTNGKVYAIRPHELAETPPTASVYQGHRRAKPTVPVELDGGLYWSHPKG